MITSDQALRSLADLLAQEPAFSFDTESNSLHAYQEEVCLIQISTRKQDFLLDPLALPNLEPLAPIFANPAIQKVLHSGDYDIACLKRDFGFSFANLFDTMLAAQTVGETNLGLAALLEAEFSLSLEKKFQRADWGQRPLPAEMLRYAQNDSRYLLDLRDRFLPRLRATGRMETFEEDCAALAKTPPALGSHELKLGQIKGAQALKPNQLGALNALQQMRDELARKKNKPPFKILSDQALVVLALNQPRYMQELQQLPELTPGLIRRYGRPILTTLESWRANPYTCKLPRHPRMDEARHARREKLSDWRKERGKAEGLPSNLILPKELLDAITLSPLASLADLKKRMASSPSRFARYGQQIYRLMTKEIETA